MVLSVSATGLLNCAALLFLPAILAVSVVALASSAFGSSTTLLAGLLPPVLALALALGRWAAARAGVRLLALELEAPAKGPGIRVAPLAAANAQGLVNPAPSIQQLKDSQEQFR